MRDSWGSAAERSTTTANKTEIAINALEFVTNSLYRKCNFMARYLSMAIVVNTANEFPTNMDPENPASDLRKQ